MAQTQYLQIGDEELDRLKIEISVNMPDYTKCHMSMIQHILAYLVSAAAMSVLAWLFYHLILVAVIMGLILAVLVERMYANSTVKKRQANLRKQFRDFLEAMSVASRAGQTEVLAITSALKDLVVSYNVQTDIVKEVAYIITMYQDGGRKLPALFREFGERSGLADIQNFAEIYAVIAGRSDRFSDILAETQEILRDKMEIEQEIITSISGAKSEAYIMLIIPIIMLVMLTAMGSDMTDSLFTTPLGHLTATIALVIFAVSYFLAMKFCDVKV